MNTKATLKFEFHRLFFIFLWLSFFILLYTLFFGITFCMEAVSVVNISRGTIKPEHVSSFSNFFNSFDNIISVLGIVFYI